jgi:peptidoglycan L-alanyl-D-glutamate endopeptidase CwlK
MASRDIYDLDKKLQDAYVEAVEKWKYLYPNRAQPFLTCTHRNHREQEQLYAIGRNLPGKIVTNAKPGQSKHNTVPSKAFDIAFNFHGRIDWDVLLFKDFAAIIKPMGITWGGDFKSIKDMPHFEI